MRLETRGPEIGPCNICGKIAKLTEDHIPPKGIPRVGQAYATSLVAELGAEKVGKGSRLFQSGVKYRSICRACNGDLLGAAYDPHLINFCKQVDIAFRDRLYMPQDFEIQPNRVFRSVLGHLLAHGVSLHRTGPFPAAKSDYVIDPGQAFPPDLRLYCWLYPYHRQVMSRWMSRIFDLRWRETPFIFSIAKYFPVAWLCGTSDLPTHIPAGVIRVDTLSTTAINDLATITFNPSHVPPPGWPEAPEDNGITLLNSNRATVATRNRQG